MRIFVFAHAVRAGGGRATCTNILHSLHKVDKDNDYFLILPDQPEYRALNLKDEKHDVYYYRRSYGHVGRWFFDTFMLKQMVRRYRPDVVWGMGNLGMFVPPCPQAISIQSPYLLYDIRRTGRLIITDKIRLFFLRRSFTRSVSRTALVFCQTATMEHRLRTVFGFEGKTVVTSKKTSVFATSADEAATGPLEACESKFKLFYLTRYYPHKGLEMLVDVMDRYRDELSDTVAVITIEPSQHPAVARLLKKIDKRDLKDRVVNVGRLVPGELAGYYGACNALVMPTRLESFSGTYLEAMHFGLPILTSDLDFAREVCGDAALYFDPMNAASIKETILRVKDDPELRRDLVARGKTRLARCTRSWEDISRMIKENLEQLVGKGP